MQRQAPDQKGWANVTAANLNPIVTIGDLITMTGLSRWTVREMLSRYHVPTLPRYGERDTRRYLRQHVLDAIAAMPGSGTQRRPQP